MGCPCFSVILPIYNAEQTLRRAVESVLSQSFADFELLLVDDGSTDGSRVLIDEMEQRDGRIRVFHKINGGASSARNEALQYIRGDYVVFCDADDWVEEDWLQNFADNMKDNVIVVQGWTYVIGLKVEPQFLDGMVEDVALAVDEMSRRESFGFLVNKCFQADIIQENKLRFDPRFRFLEDEEFVCRYCKFVQRVKFVSCAAYHYLLPDFKKKYVEVDNFELYISLLDNASKFITSPNSVTMQKYTMGLFRNMMLAFQHRNYREAWSRLRLFVTYGHRFKQYNFNMRIISCRNYWLWYPILVVYNFRNIDE